MKTRQTRQKEIIEREIEKINRFFSAEDLFERVSKVDIKMGIATIYRYLKDLRDKDKIYSYTCQGKVIYSSTKRSHCHFECVDSGKIIHFELDNLDFLKDKIPGEIESFQLEVKGKLL
ncbi:MAG: transcriptional repressor [Nanoarchaeota archaeon]|nr:transcriptional repressor [Nanoarchaeota archaeon]